MTAYEKWELCAPGLWQSTGCLGAKRRACHGRNLAHILFGEAPFCLVNLLAVPFHDIGIKPLKPVSRAIPMPKFESPVIFTDLPTEIHDIIYIFLDIKSVILLGLTSTYFWNTCRRHVWSYQRLYHGQWSGEKIICVGEHIKPFDHPPGLFSEHEARHLFSNEFYRARLGLEKGQNADLHSFASTFDEEPKDWRLTYMLDLSEVYGMDWYDLVYSVLGNNHRPSDFADMCKPRLSDFYPENQSWILRNLTTLEYIRSEAIALKPEYIRGPFIDYLGFGHVVLSRICWSSNSLSSVEDDVSTMRGIWAGHRFDITTVEKHKQSIRNYEEWEDISEEIAQEVARIWESVFGEHWREKLDFDGVF